MRLVRYFTAVVACFLALSHTALAYVPIVDAGHGGFDGGAISSNGVIESGLNLEISQRVVTLFRFLGVEPVVVRETETSLAGEHSKGRSAKNEDLKRRVEICDNTDDGLLISIHQNQFSDSRYSGLHAFYSREQTKPFADALQQTVTTQIDPANNRIPKSVPSGLYLFKKTVRPAVLIECGFLSNEAELALLQTPVYQKKLACAIVGEFLRFNNGLTQ